MNIIDELSSSPKGPARYLVISWAIKPSETGIGIAGKEWPVRIRIITVMVRPIIRLTNVKIAPSGPA